MRVLLLQTVRINGKSVAKLHLLAFGKQRTARRDGRKNQKNNTCCYNAHHIETRNTHSHARTRDRHARPPSGDWWLRVGVSPPPMTCETIATLRHMRIRSELKKTRIVCNKMYCQTTLRHFRKQCFVESCANGSRYRTQYINESIIWQGSNRK